LRGQRSYDETQEERKSSNRKKKKKEVHEAKEKEKVRRSIPIIPGFYPIPRQ